MIPVFLALRFVRRPSSFKWRLLFKLKRLWRFLFLQLIPKVLEVLCCSLQVSR